MANLFAENGNLGAIGKNLGGKTARNVENEVRITALCLSQGILELIKLLLKQLLIILTRQKIETVDSKGFDIVTVFENDSADALHGVIPLTILNMNLAFFSQNWTEVRVEYGDL